MLFDSCRNNISAFRFLGSNCCQQPSEWGYFSSKSLFWILCPWYALSCLALWNMSMKKWNPSHCVSEVHLLSDIFKICCQLQLVSNQGWQDSSCAPFMSCFSWFCMHEMDAQNRYVLSQQMGPNKFYTLSCKWRPCANNSVLAVRWNFIVDKTLRKKNPLEKNNNNNKSVLSLSLRSAIILWLLASPFWLCCLALGFLFISSCFACVAAIPDLI